ncbi:hypothetical protein AB4Z48_12855 [Cupriavidus sp. 2TAF22]
MPASIGADADDKETGAFLASYGFPASDKTGFWKGSKAGAPVLQERFN